MAADHGNGRIGAMPRGNQRAQIAGLELGWLTGVAFVRMDRNQKSIWLFRCRCGHTEERAAATVLLSIRKGREPKCKQCNAAVLRKTLNISLAQRPNWRRGARRHPLHSIWRHMVRRCDSPKDRDYANYGGRGIRVCERWRESFWLFTEDMGQRPSPQHSLDRINNDGNYEPGNVRWATAQMQCSNQRRTKFVECGGASITVSEAARMHGMSPVTLHLRLRHGWDLGRALTTPVRPTKKTGQKRRAA